MSIIIRIRTREKMERLEVNPMISLSQLKDIILNQLNKNANILSKDINGKEKLIGDTKRLKDFGISNGFILYLIEPFNEGKEEMKIDELSMTHRLSKKCNHGLNGKCVNCVPIEKSGVRKCEHGPGVSCVNCTKSKGEDIEWLCNHPPDQMCANCMILGKDEKVELEMLCLHGENAVCTNCLPPPPMSNAKHISYNQYIADEKLLCQHPRSGKNICVHCIPPEQITYKIKPGCSRHKPWPDGLCSDCKPTAATLKRQIYRHVDYIEFLHIEAFNKFLLPWSNTGRICQRFGIMIGYYAPDPNYVEGVKAVVQEIYEPNQDFSEGVIHFLEDPLMDRAMPFINDLGLQPIGWIFTHETREDIITSRDMEYMYKMQTTYMNQDTKLSRFVTVSVSFDEVTNQISPHGYMLSDQGMALYRDGIIGPPTNLHVCTVKKSERRSEYVTDVLRNDKELGTQNVSEFEPEFLLVVVNCGAPKVTDTSCYVYPYEDFTPLHRDIFGELPNDDEYAKCLTQRKNDVKWKQFADFHMFMYSLLYYEESFVMTMNKMIKEKSTNYLEDIDTFVMAILK